MNKFFKLFLMPGIIAGVLAAASCTKTCDTGYEGSKCDIKMNTKFAQTWIVNDTARINSTADSFYHYTMTISASSTDPTAISIQNFGGFNSGSSISGVISNSTNMTIPTVVIGNVTISNGAGTINSAGNVLTFTYTATDNSGGVAIDHAVGTH